MSHYAASSQYYHFQIIFYEATLNIVRYYYFQDSDGGSSATIGVQGKLLFIWLQSINDSFIRLASSTGPAMTYAVNQANAVPIGTVGTNVATVILEFNTNTGVISCVG